MNTFQALKEELDRVCPGLKIKEQEPMSLHTSFRIGGPVAMMAFPMTTEETVASIQAARRLGITPFLLGRGSNLLCGDGELNYFMIKTNPGLTQLERVGENAILCGAGVPMRQAANFAQKHGLSGLEFAHGIPGSIGGGVVMNAGAYGGELANVVKETTALNRQGNVEVIRGEQQEFSYRSSVFAKEGSLVLSALIELRPGDPAEIQAQMDDFLTRRKRTQPLEYPSAGSMFKRPKGAYAAALIDKCGLKGFRVGDAQVSEKHAGFVVNRGHATCQEMLTLVRHVQKTVKDKTGFQLDMEVITLL